MYHNASRNIYVASGGSTNVWKKSKQYTCIVQYCIHLPLQLSVIWKLLQVWTTYISNSVLLKTEAVVPELTLRSFQWCSCRTKRLTQREFEMFLTSCFFGSLTLNAWVAEGHVSCSLHPQSISLWFKMQAAEESSSALICSQGGRSVLEVQRSSEFVKLLHCFWIWILPQI